MAQQLPVPWDPQLPVPTGPQYPINYVEWAITILKSVAPLFDTINQIDAKFGVLIGDDTREVPLSDYLPQGLVDLIAKRSTYVRHPISNGVLSNHELVSDKPDPVTGIHPDEWVSIYMMIRNLLWGITKTLHHNPEITQPFFRKTQTENPLQDGEADCFSYRESANTVTLEQPKPDLVTLLASISSLLSVASDIPYPQLQPFNIHKTVPELNPFNATWNGSLADVVLGQDVELLSRHEVFVQANTKTEP